jgi:hypothetical protein
MLGITLLLLTPEVNGQFNNLNGAATGPSGQFGPLFPPSMEISAVGVGLRGALEAVLTQL